MEPSFWHARWEKRRIGFHRGEVNPFLVQYWSSLNLKPDSRVFVPLCGKSLDMCFLAEIGHEVVGCELSEHGANDFFKENDLPVEVKQANEHQLFCTDQLTIIQGDLFTLTADIVEQYQGFYDRAALIAWPESMRLAYVKQLARLLPRGCRGLLITLDFEPEVVPGPPFAVPETWMMTHMQPYFEINRLMTEDVLADSPRFIKNNATWLTESVYQLVRK